MLEVERGFVECDKAQSRRVLAARQIIRENLVCKAQRESLEPSDDNERSGSVKSSRKHAFEASNTCRLRHIVEVLEAVIIVLISMHARSWLFLSRI